MDEVTAPRNVVEALRAVMQDLPGIGKDGRGPQSQGGYAYRGIEAITAEAQKLFAKYGVVFTPRVVSWESVGEGEKSYDDKLMVEYTVYGPGGNEDFIVVGPVPGRGRDNSDKGSNKAMTSAFKYVLLQTLCIGDPKDDGDSQHISRDEPTWRYANGGELAAVRLAISTLSPDTAGELRVWWKQMDYGSAAEGGQARKLTDFEALAVLEKIEALRTPIAVPPVEADAAAAVDDEATESCPECKCEGEHTADCSMRPM